VTHPCVANGVVGAGAHTCPASQSAGPVGAEAAHARATWVQVGAGVVATPPLAVHVPPVGAGADTIVERAKMGVCMHELDTVIGAAYGLLQALS
jgi:hypothetical protein